MKTQTNNTIDEILDGIWGGAIDFTFSEDLKNLESDHRDKAYFTYKDNVKKQALSQLKQVILDEVVGRNQAESDMPDNKVLLTGKQIIENDLRAKQRTIVEELFK